MFGKAKGRKGGRRTKKAARPKCRTITFKRAKKGDRILPRSQWVTVERCEGKSAKRKWKAGAKARKQCRKGGMGADWAKFVKCPARGKLHSYGGERIYVRPTH